MHLDEVASGAAVANSPLVVQVFASSPDASHSTNNIADVAPTGSVSTATALVNWKLKVYPVDKYDNPISNADGYSVSVVDESTKKTDTFTLEGPSFEAAISIPKLFSGRKTFSFTYLGKDIKGSPIPVSFKPPPNIPPQSSAWDTKTKLIVIGAAGLTLVFAV